MKHSNVDDSAKGSICTNMDDQIQLDLGALMIKVDGTSVTSKGHSIWFKEIKEGRDKGFWACQKCGVAFTDDWRVKHVNWHYRTRGMR